MMNLRIKRTGAKLKSCLFYAVSCILLIANLAQAISPEDLVETIIKEIKKQHSRSVIFRHYNWQVIFEEQRSVNNPNSDSPKSAEELKQRSLAFAETGQIVYPKDIIEILRDPQKRKAPSSALPPFVAPNLNSESKDKLSRADFFIKEISIKDKTAVATIKQVLDQQIYPATLYLRYIRDNWYVDHLKPGNLGFFKQD